MAEMFLFLAMDGGMAKKEYLKRHTDGKSEDNHHEKKL